MKKLLLFILYFILISKTSAQDFVSWDSKKIILDNQAIRREINIDSLQWNGFTTKALKIMGDDKSYTTPNNLEFYFEANDLVCTGKSKWEILSIKKVNDHLKGNGVSITLRSKEPRLLNLEISVIYMLYPELPLIRKRIEFKNTGSEELKIESVDVENFTLPWGDTHLKTLHNYARNETLGPYKGNWYDPAVIVHNIAGNCGVVLGNEAPGVVKRTTVVTDGKTVTIGLNHKNEGYGIRKWLKMNEGWSTPWAFIALYHNTEQPYDAINTVVNDYVRKHMGIRLAEIKNKPTFVYNTWIPFWGDINEKMMYELIDANYECGIKEFIIDAGWATTKEPFPGEKNDKWEWMLTLGDWKINPVKFPNGFKPIFDYLKAKGMKPGLWISMATATKASTLFKTHPEWFVQDENGNPAFLHDESGNPNQLTACLGSGYYDYIKEVILKFVKEYGLEFIKLDLSIVTSAYRYNAKTAGCFAQNHAYHKDHEESYLALYERCFQLFDELHREAPDLFIDCTFETLGKLQLVDFEMLKHAEGNWLSNFEDPQPQESWRIRQMAWWRSPMIPATSLVIGNTLIEDTKDEFVLNSLAGTLPILLGDPRKLTVEERANIKNWADWLQALQDKYDFMMYRQELPGFGEPSNGFWDGWARINTDTKAGGIIGIFRHNSIENERTILIPYLLPHKTYIILQGKQKKLLIKATGKDLAERGFKITLEKKYDSAILEVKLDK